MLWQRVVEAVIYILSIYGFMCLVEGIFIKINTEKNKQINPDIFLVVKNRQENIEGLIRSILAGNFLEKQIPGAKLYVVDMESKDDTYAILSKIENQYQGRLELISTSQAISKIQANSSGNFSVISK